MPHILHEILHLTAHALGDSLLLLPFLFLTYLFMEFLEHKAGNGFKNKLESAGRVGPLWGGLLGLIPQCGFSAAVAGLFSGRIVTVGTLVAIFLATSDEMLPIFIGAGLPVTKTLAVLGIKLVVAVAVGFLLDLLWRRPMEEDFSHVCEAEDCHCEEGVLRSALHHTLHIFAFVFIINLILTALLEYVGAEALGRMLPRVPVVGALLGALVGLIPNCAVSVAIATLYAQGVISAGTMLAGLLTGAGTGLLVLFRANRHPKENLTVCGILLLVGVLFGTLLDTTGLAALLGL